MEARQKINIERSKRDVVLEWSAAILLFLMWALMLYTLLKLPTIIPLRYDVSGKVTKYGHKTTLLIFPVVSTVIYFLLSCVNRFPHTLNYLTRLSLDNVKKQYHADKTMLAIVKLFILIVFTLIILIAYLAAAGITNGPGTWILPVTIGLSFTLAILTIVRSLKPK